jgi:hypothetical protein
VWRDDNVKQKGPDIGEKLSTKLSGAGRIYDWRIPSAWLHSRIPLPPPLNRGEQYFRLLI